MSGANVQVDVVVPCYNYARYLPQCLDSIRKAGSTARVLIIDDCSTDDTPEVGQQLAAADPLVEFRRHAKNQGHINTYNEGLIDWAQSPYSILLSADDLLAPGSLERAVRLMDRHPEVHMTYGFATIFTDTKPPVVDQASDEHQLIPGPQLIQRICAEGNVVPTPAAIVRTAIQQQVGGYKRHLPHSGDMEMWLRFASLGPVGVFNAVQAHYRVHDTNMSRQIYSLALRDRHEQLEACREACEFADGRVPGFADWVAAMAERFAAESFWVGSSAFDRNDAELTAKCMELAREFDPSIVRSRMWRRFRLKQVMGPRLWKGVRKLLNRHDDAGSGVEDRAPPPGSRIGWWPGQVGS